MRENFLNSNEVYFSLLRKKLAEYQRNYVLNRDGMRPGDCAKVALSATEHFLKRLNSSKVINSGTISVDNKVRIPKFGNQNFTNHVINFIEFSNGTWLAFDLTAKYTLMSESVPIKYFLASSQEELNLKLKSFYKTQNNWH